MRVRPLAVVGALLWASCAYAGAAPAALQELIDDTLQRNASLKEAVARRRAAEHRPVQEAALPDPQISATQYVRTPETRVGPQFTALSISQRFPWRGKLIAQQAVAESDVEVAEAAIDVNRAEIVQAITSAYWDLAYADRAAEIVEEDLEILRHFEALAQARYSQGIGLQLAALKLQADITRGLNRLQQLRRRRTDVEAMINALRDREPDTPIGRTQLPESDSLSLDLPTLYAAARNRRPDLLSAELQTQTEMRRLDSAHKQGMPDVTVGAGYTLVGERGDQPGIMIPPVSNGKDIYSLSVAFNLPIFRKKYRAGVDQASQNVVAAEHRYRALWNQTQAEIRASAFDVGSIEEQLRLFENSLLPQAEQALRSSEQAYATGGASVLDLLDSERTLIEVRLGLAQLQADRFKSIADLERAVGAPLSEVLP